MLKIKNLTLQNYTGYKNAFFDFTRPGGSYKPVSVFFGPNGIGKSTCLNAINLIGQCKQYVGRKNDLIFRKLTYHPDYDPTLPHFAAYTEKMRIEAVFELDGEEKRVIVTSDGVEKCELSGSRNSVFIAADHPMSMKRFQIPSDRVDIFLDVARAVYGYDVKLDKPVETFESQWDGREDTYEKFQTGQVEGMKIVYFQDFILDKGDVKVHFKSMSDGEQKIATVLRSLCDPALMDVSDIVLIDNIEMHVYMERHAPMLKKLVECFPSKQFILTSHSPILVGMNKPNLGIYIKSFVAQEYGEDCLFDVMQIKGQKFTC